MNSLQSLNILAVDDDEMNADILAKNIEDFGHTPYVTEDGIAAWDFLNEHKGKINIVILDRMMPRMSGIELAKKMQSDPILRKTPVIIQSGKAGNDHLQDALNVGALFYLTKPFSPDDMRSMIDSVAYNLHREKRIHDLMKEQIESSVAEFEVKTLEDMYEVISKISFNAINKCKARYVLTELILNAIEHGNLNIGYERKEELLKTQLWEGEITKLLNLPENADKKVQIKATQTHDCLEVIIKDQGNGFNWEEYKEFKAEQITKVNGRGIAQAFRTTPTIEYVGNGNEVHCKFYTE